MLLFIMIMLGDDSDGDDYYDYPTKSNHMWEMFYRTGTQSPADKFLMPIISVKNAKPQVQEYKIFLAKS